MFKRTLSIILITALLTLSLAILPVSAQPQSSPVELPATGANSTAQLSADNSFGEIFTSAVSRKQNTGSNCVTNVTVNGSIATVTLTHEEGCIVIVGIYDESGEQYITSSYPQYFSANDSSYDVAFRDELPEFFYLRAFVLDITCSPIGEQYESARYTRAYREFLDKTADDFSEERVINFDNDPQDNFAVFDEAVRTVTTSSSVNIPAKTSENTYSFTHIDDSLRGLQTGDIFTFELSDNPEVVKVGSAQYSGDALTVTAVEAQLEEVFAYVKIDTGSDRSQNAPTGGENPQSAAQTAPSEKGALAPTGLDFDVQYSVSETYPLGPEAGDNFAGVTGSVDLGLTVTLKLYYCDDIFETSLILDVGGNINVTLLAKFSRTIFLGEIPVPTPIPSVTVNVKVELELEAEAKVEVNVPFKSRTGFSYSSLSGFANLSTLPEFDFNGSCEGKAYAGIKVTPALSALLGMVKVGMGGKIGLEAVGTRMPTVSDFKGSDHLCRWCIQGSLNIVFGLDAQVKVVKTWTKDLGSISKKLFDFHYSSDNGFGHGMCQNKRTPPEEEITHPDVNNLPTAGTTTTSCSLSGPHDDLTMTVHVSGSGAVNGNQVSDDMSVYESENIWKFNEQVEKDGCEKYEINYDWYKTAPYLIGIPEEFDEYCAARYRSIGHYKFYVHGFTIVKDFPRTEIEAITGPCEYLGIDAYSVPDTVRVAGSWSSYGNMEMNVANNVPSSLEYNYCTWVKAKNVTASACLKYTAWDAFPNVETATLLSEAEHVFYNCKKLRQATIGDNVTKLSNRVFSGCTALKSITIPSSVIHIASGAFNGSGLERVTIPGSVKKIDNYAFNGCQNLREVVIEEGVKEIAYNAFADCPKLERVVLPKSLAVLNIGAFENDPQFIVDYQGDAEGWYNTLMSSSYYNDILEERYGDPVYHDYDFGFVVFCCPAENSAPASTGSGLAPTGSGENLLSGLNPGVDYLITVIDNPESLLYSNRVAALKQIKANENGCIDVSDIDVPEGMHLKAFGKCRHTSAHAQTQGGQIVCACDSCGESVAPIIAGESSHYIAEEERVRGDADCDKRITILDATAIQRKLADYLPTYWHTRAADADGDGTVTILDATAIQRWLAAYDPDKYGINEPLH